MTWHGDFEIRDPVALRNRPGLSYVMIYNDLPTMPSTDLWEEDDSAELLQHSARSTTPQILSLADLVPATTAVRIVDGSGFQRLPNPLEVQQPGDPEQVRQELLQWGHQCEVFQCLPHQTFLCLDPCTVEEDSSSSKGPFHYLFSHENPDEGPECLFHSSSMVLTEVQVLRTLYDLGYPRAVIRQWDQLRRDWQRIVFHHQEPQVDMPARKGKSPSPWPPRGDHRRTNKKLLDLHHVPLLQSLCTLHTGFDNEDLVTLFSSGIDILHTSFDQLELPEAFAVELRNYEIVPLHDVQQLDNYDRLILFMDGSSLPSMRRRRTTPEQADDRGHPDTWAFLVVAETFGPGTDESTCVILGWTAQPVRYDALGSAYTGITRLGSEMAERSALMGAAMWRLSLNHQIATVFASDSLLCGNQATGIQGTSCVDDSYRLMRGLFQALEIALPLGALQVQHVRAHVGALFNEVVDVAAKREARHSFNLPRQKLDMRVWRSKFPYLWLLFGHRCGMPMWNNGVLDVEAPDLPCASPPMTTPSTIPMNHRRMASFACSLATANVQSLYRGPLGHAGKLHYIKQQMRSFGLNVLAVQEARSEAGMFKANNILRLCSGHQQGHYGIELWFDLERPFGVLGEKRGLFFKTDHFQVVYNDSRKLLVRCDTGHFSCWFVAAHAPHGGHHCDTRHQWWRDLGDLLHAHLDGDPLFLMMDANASPGECDHQVVLRPGFDASPNTEEFRDLLRTWGLFLPATSDIHHGPHGTWTGFDGETEHTIDHIAVPSTWSSACVYSSVLQDFDLATTNLDHKVVALQLEWKAMIWQSDTPSATGYHRPPLKYAAKPSLDAQLATIPSLPWRTDVETQALHLTDALHGLFGAQEKGYTHAVHKPYIDDEVWALREMKIKLGRRLKQARARRAQHSLTGCFFLWKATVRERPAEDSAIILEDFQFHTTFLCAQVRLLAHHRNVCKAMRSRLTHSKQKALHDTVVACSADLSASELLRRLRHFTGPSNPKKHKFKPLPMVDHEDGTPCSLPSEAVAIWVQFFQTMEGGERMSFEQLRQQWITELQAFRSTSLQVSVDQLPSLTDLEVALRRVPQGRACGPDGIPGELCRHHAARLAKQLYPHLAKIVLQSKEFLGFKSGRLTPAYKGRGPTNRCSSYRSLLVSSHLGKTVHRAIRQRHADLFESWLQRQQTGGRRKIPVQLAVHQLRAFLRHCRSQNKSVGVLYLDLTEAFYRILQEIPLGGEASDLLIAHVMKRLNMPPDSLHHLHALLQQPCALLQAGMSEMDRPSIQAVHTSTHFWIRGQEDYSRTRLGSRPGDCFADWIFSFAWSQVLHKVEKFMVERELHVDFQGHEFLPLFGRQGHTEQRYTFLGPNWMDDLALVVQADTSDQLVSHIGCLTGYLLDVCAQHCMTPNLSRGKTEIALTFRGKGSRRARTAFYGPAATLQLPIACEHEVEMVQLVKRYKHLGGLSHHSGDQQAEIKQRVAIAHRALSQHGRVLFRNPLISLQKRAEHFVMLVLSKLLYGAESWVAHNDKTYKQFHTAVINLYKRLARIRPDAHCTDTEVLVQVGLPSPEELLRQTRLRYFVTLVHTGLPDLWALLACD
eukprot:s86_g23.t1